MSRNSQINLWRISSEFDWQGYVDEHYGAKTTPRGELRICCPSCGENDYKCYVNPNKGCFYCFKCTFRSGKNYKYTLADFVAKTENITPAAALKRLLIEYAPTTPNELSEEMLQTRKEEIIAKEIKYLDSLPDKAVKLVHGQNEWAWEYLHGRGLSEREIKICNTYVIPDDIAYIYNSAGKIAGNLGKRILWPVYGPQNKLVSYIARTTNPAEKKQKYLNCPGSDLSKTFWPFVPPKEGTVILVEGILDALALRRAGLPGYACFGKHLSDSQIKILKTWDTKNVIVFFDIRDAYGEIVKLVDGTLKNIFDGSFVLSLENWPDGQDPGDCLKLEDGVTQLKKQIDSKINSSSLDYTKWKFQHANKRA